MSDIQVGNVKGNKPGVKTSEFYLTLIAMITGLGLSTGMISSSEQQQIIDVIGPEEIDQAKNCISFLVEKISGVVVVIGSLLGYSWTRVRIKLK